MAEARLAEEDSLASLEERIRRAVELVATLRREKEELVRQLDAARLECESARRAAGANTEQTEKLAREVEDLRAERATVRKRIEKLLGQMDQLSGA